MKKFFSILLVTMSLLTFSQSSNNIAAVTSPGSFDDGVSFGLNYEHQSETFYVGPEVYFFPNLNNMDYAHFIGRFGVNYEYGTFEKLRFFGGVRIGALFRDSNNSGVHALLGGEIGLQYTLQNNLFIRLSGATDVKTDSKIWSNDDSHTVNSVFVSVGFRFT